MNQDIIKMAKEAGAKFDPSMQFACNVWTETFEHFFHMAQADMKEKCAKVCDAHAYGWENNPGMNPMAGFIASSNCAAAIRAIGDSHDQT